MLNACKVVEPWQAWKGAPLMGNAGDHMPAQPFVSHMPAPIQAQM